MRTLHRAALACLALAACNGPNQPTPRGPYMAECTSTAGPSGTDSAIANKAGSATVQVPGAVGQYVLQVPAGAADSGTVFILTAMKPPRVGVEAHVRGQPTYNFRNGLSATLRMNAQQCTADEFGRLRSPAILRLERDSTLTALPSGPVQGSPRTLSAQLPSLSGYVVGSN